jgi:cysteine desulfurase
MRVFFDNAATTPPDPKVIDRIGKVLRECYGNPSSIHFEGRESRALIEKARKNIAEKLGAAPGEIFFTSGGTEADNMVLTCSVLHQNVKHIITSAIEHHAVLHTVKHLEKNFGVKVSYVNLTPDGHIDFNDLKQKLRTNSSGKMLVSLMHANNEIGNITDIQEAGALCTEYDALFHTDSVQTIGHLPVNPREAGVHFLAASAHKFHGPKGVGFAYINHDIRLQPFIQGGAQERNMRGGTENIYGIVGMETALDLAIDQMDKDKNNITEIRNYFAERLREDIPGVQFNGDPFGNGLYTILNVQFPGSQLGDMFLFNLDIGGVSASGGSACSSGSDTGSHVLREVYKDQNREGVAVRFSFGRFNTKNEVDIVMEKINECFEGAVK